MGMPRETVRLVGAPSDPKMVAVTEVHDERVCRENTPLLRSETDQGPDLELDALGSHSRDGSDSGKVR